MEFSKILSSIMIKNDQFHTLPVMRSLYLDTRRKNQDYFATKLSMDGGSDMRAGM